MSCGGSGYITVPVCCYRPNRDGSCCGEPEPGQEGCDGCPDCWPDPEPSLEQGVGLEQRLRVTPAWLADAGRPEPAPDPAPPSPGPF